MCVLCLSFLSILGLVSPIIFGQMSLYSICHESLLSWVPHALFFVSGIILSHSSISFLTSINALPLFFLFLPISVLEIWISDLKWVFTSSGACGTVVGSVWGIDMQFPSSCIFGGNRTSLRSFPDAQERCLWVPAPLSIFCPRFTVRPQPSYQSGNCGPLGEGLLWG